MMQLGSVPLAHRHCVHLLAQLTLTCKDISALRVKFYSTVPLKNVLNVPLLLNWNMFYCDCCQGLWTRAASILTVNIWPLHLWHRFTQTLSPGWEFLKRYIKNVSLSFSTDSPGRTALKFVLTQWCRGSTTCSGSCKSNDWILYLYQRLYFCTLYEH